MTVQATSSFIPRLSWPVLTAIAISLGLLLGAIYWAFDRRGGEGEVANFSGDSLADYHNAARVVSESDRIFIATYLEARTEEVDLISLVTGKVEDVHESRTDVVWRFEVVETLKGSLSPGDVQEVINTSEVRLPANEFSPAVEWQYEILSLSQGQQYLVFLREGREQDGSTIWGLAGTPGVAKFTETDNLDFLVTERYIETARELGLVSGDQRVPFTATLDEIRAEVARQAAAPSPTPATPAPEPTPAKTVPSNP